MTNYDINILLTGMPVCEILIVNPLNDNDPQLACTALVDTGSDCSILSESMFEKFDTKERDLSEARIRNIDT